jgi:hypothetical protein
MPKLRRAGKAIGEEVRSVSQPLVNEQSHMSSRSTEGGDKPQNQGLSNFQVPPEKRGLGPRVKKSGEPKQPSPDPGLEAIKQMLRKPRRSLIAGGEAHIRNQERLWRAYERDDNEGAEDKG